MSQELDASAVLRAWNERMDSVAAQFVLGEAASVDSVAESLAWMRQEAEGAGWDEIARLAARIHDRMKASAQWFAEGALAENWQVVATGEVDVARDARLLRRIDDRTEIEILAGGTDAQCAEALGEFARKPVVDAVLDQHA